MNILDIVLLCLFIPGIIRGLAKGFLEQGIALAGIWLSVYVASQCYGYVCHYLKNIFAFSDTVLNIVSFVLVLVVALFVVLMIGKVITNVVEMASLGWLNRMMGLVFAILLTALVLGLLITFFDTLNQKFQLVQSPVLEQSMLYTPLRDLGDFIFPYLKELVVTQAAPATTV